MKTILLFFLLFITSLIYSQAVNLDPTFGNNGFAAVPLETNGSSFVQSKIQSDGKILISGNRIDGSIMQEDFVARYNSNGTVDTSFGVNGFFIYDNTIHDINGPNIFLLANGQIICVVSDNIGEIIKLNSNGTIDNSFGNGGKLTFMFPAILNDYQFLDTNDNFYINLGSKIRKINTANGSTDTTFGINGEIQLQSSIGNGEIYSFKNNKFLMEASQFPVIGPTPINLMRFNIDGTLDSTFANNGVLVIYSTTNLNDLDFIAHNITVDNNDNIYVNQNNRMNYTANIRKFDINGALVNTFGNNGISNLPVNNISNSIQIVGNKLYLAGFNKVAGVTNSSILRFDQNGNIDNSFDSDGIYIENNNNLSEGIETFSVNNDGSMIAAGEYKNGTYNKIYLAKYIDNNLSIEDFNGINITYTNPVYNKLEILSNKDIQTMMLFSADGSFIKSTSNNILETSELSCGFYYAKIKLSDKTRVIKVIKR